MEATGPRLHVVVPVFNETGNLERLLQAFREIAARWPRARFLLCDDGSTDGTPERARSLAGALDLVVLIHPRNRGPGRAFATAFAHLATNLSDTDWVVTMEGDNTSRHELLDQMLGRAEREGFAVVLASPYLYGGGIVHTNVLRVFVSAVANLFVKELLGLQGILTVSSFFRVYRGSFFRKLQLHYGPGIVERAGFECMVEMLMKITHLGASITEVAMVLDTSRRAGSSKMKIGRTTLGYLALWWHRRRWQT
jgi:dolichol-phosphate mannosyltransferase